MQENTPLSERKAAWRALGIFLSITVVLTSVFGGLMAFQGGTPSLLVTGVMWSPGVAAILTCLILKRPISSLPWRWGRSQWNWYAWLLPIAYGLVIYLPVWVLGLGGSGFGNVETLTAWTNQVTGGDKPNIVSSVTALVMLATVGMVSASSRALGEEIGWRTGQRPPGLDRGAKCCRRQRYTLPYHWTGVFVCRRSTAWICWKRSSHAVFDARPG